MAPALTQGAIEKLIKDETVDRPILQILGTKKIAGNTPGADRYRLLLSDGIHSHSSAMLATQLNDKVMNGEIDKYTVVQLEKYLCNTIPPNRRVVIVLDITVLTPADQVGTTIGSPQPYKLGETPAATSAAPAAQNDTGAPPQKLQKIDGNARVPATPPSAPKPSFYGSNRNVTSVAGGAPGTPNTPGGTPARVHPIASLTPYQNRWTIRVRVTHKSAIRTWSNSRGEGKLFSINLLDDSGEIKCTMFRDQVDKYHDMLEVNKVYYISKATLKTADKRYSSLKNDYEMTFNNDTQLWICEDTDNLPTISFNFVNIGDLENHEPNSTIDILGVVKEIGDIATITTKASNKEVTKREVQIVDESRAQVRLTLWGADAETFDGSNNPILAVKSCRLSDWGGRSVSASSTSQIVINPDIPEAHHLRGWYDNEGHASDFAQFQRGDGGSGGGHTTNWKTFSEVKAQGPVGDQALYFSNKATVVFLKKDNCMYQACPTADCNKKVIDQGNGMFRCEKCNKEFPNHKWRMILSTNLADFSDNQWATCFQETAECILGRPADELGALRESNETEFEACFQEANFKSYIMKFRAKMETYNDENRLKTVCVQATPVNYKEYNKVLIENIEKMLVA